MGKFTRRYRGNDIKEENWFQIENEQKFDI